MLSVREVAEIPSAEVSSGVSTCSSPFINKNPTFERHDKRYKLVAFASRERTTRKLLEKLSTSWLLTDNRDQGEYPAREDPFHCVLI
jgi:hypothetical protein